MRRVGMTDAFDLSDTTLIKAGNAFCISLRDAGLPLAAAHPLGVYVTDCRHLRGHELRVGGRQPRLLTSTDAAGTAAVFELTNPDLVLGDGRKLPMQSLRIRAERRMLPREMEERITVRSHARGPVALELELQLDADFATMLEVRGLAPRRLRQVRRQTKDDALEFAVIGLDGAERSTTIRCRGADALDGRLRSRLELSPGEEASLHVHFEFAQERGGTIAVSRDQDTSEGPFASEAGAGADAWLAGRCRVAVDHEPADHALRRSLLDLRFLTSDIGGHRYYAAGVPWYATLFGRDSIIAALQTLAFDPDIALETLRALAARLGSRMDDEHDEEPGKVLHEWRQDELAAVGRSPFARYYGTVDATPLFLCLLCEYVQWTGSLELLDELRCQIDQAVAWMVRFGDLDGDRLLEYRRRSPSGLDNHCWKDSWDGVPDEFGAPLQPPIAVVEAQGYAVAARRGLARLFELRGDRRRAEEERSQAQRLQEEIGRFWLADRGFYAMALDGNKRPSRVLASNQGHLLWARAVGQGGAAAICRALMGRDSYSGWGVRTLSAEERAFNPLGYHTGAVWPHDNAMFAAGLRRYGFDRSFRRIMEDLLAAALALPDHRLPELFAGFPRADFETPVPYPAACSPQAWAAGALPFMLIAGLGIAPDAPRRTLRIRRPSLPRQIGRVKLEELRVGDARVDLLFERVSVHGDQVALSDVKVDGRLDVLFEPGYTEA